MPSRQRDCSPSHPLRIILCGVWCLKREYFSKEAIPSRAWPGRQNSRCPAAAPDQAPTSARGLPASRRRANPGGEGHRAGQPSPAVIPVQNPAGISKCHHVQARVMIPAMPPGETEAQGGQPEHHGVTCPGRSWQRGRRRTLGHWPGVQRP